MNHKSIKQSSMADIDELLKSFDTSLEGLNGKQVQQCLKKYGYNVISSDKQESALIKLLSEFLSPLVVLLFTIVIISFFIGEIESAIIIIAMIIINVFMTFFQEYQADKAAEKLKKLVSTTVTVIRSGKEEEISQSELVPGDIIRLSAGNIIPADIRIISSKTLYINQSAMTGEALPVEKSEKPYQDQYDLKNNIFDIPNICFMGTNVNSGIAIGIVIATGGDTYLSSIADKLTQKTAKSSFEEGVDKFVMLLVKGMVYIVLIVFVINAINKGSWLEALLFAIAVAVGLIPEMMPMIVTINLSKGALSLSRGKVIVKKLNSVQNLGAMDVLCSDKTGTLTQNKIILEKHIDINRQENETVFLYAYINSYFQTGLKNLMDNSILEHSNKHSGKNLDIGNKYVKVDEIPFDFQRRRMSVIVNSSDMQPILVCKGAVEEVIGICDRLNDNNKILKIDNFHREKITNITKELNEDGFRVIAVAYKDFLSAKDKFSSEDENNLILIGFAAFLDPPKETAIEAIRQLYENGVDIKILTGDNEVITKKICTQVGIKIMGVVLGNDIENLSDKKLLEIVENNNIFAKLNPEHKQKIVEMLRKNRHVTGFLGDGINDALALKSADVGISVDSAADIAKESADIILLEKNLLILEKGVIEGRRVFGNITKYLRACGSSNFGNMISLATASMFLPFLPMAPVQIIAKNLLYDISQVSLFTDNVDKEYTRKPKRWDIDNIKKSMVILGPINVVFDYITFAVLIFGFNALENKELFQTGWFVKTLIAEILVVHAIRTNKIPFIQSNASVWIFLMNIFMISLIVWLIFSHYAFHLGFVALPAFYWILLVFILLLYLIATKIINKKFIDSF